MDRVEFGEDKRLMNSEKVSNYRSCFDIIGPVMIGPSSSHTAGALQIGLLARKLFGKTPKHVSCSYYESFAETHKGHGTDFAIAAGILGFSTDDHRVPNALEHAKQAGVAIDFIEKTGDSPVQHANTADLLLSDEEDEIRLIGISIGGGTVEVKYIKIEDTPIHLRGPLPILIEITKQPFSAIQSILDKHQITIANIKLYQNPTHYIFVYELKDLLSPQSKNELSSLSQKIKLFILS